MNKIKTKAIKIGGDALETIEKLSKTTFRTLKGSAEMLIDLGKIRLDILNEFIEQQKKSDTKSIEKSKNNNDE